MTVEKLLDNLDMLEDYFKQGLRATAGAPDPARNLRASRACRNGLKRAKLVRAAVLDCVAGPARKGGA